MRTASACAGEAMTTVDAAEQTAATVSAARRAEDLLGNGIPPGTYVSAGTRVERKNSDDARRNRERSEHLSPQFLRASISCVLRPLVKVSAMYGARRGDEPGGMG
ncbi:hypothetical protein SSP24_19170 [Streptomyces spinoverrucosus]|uniref:Uncharacterized protein n=1 Tax=Streptomyces spinoverrucosus TaxID=284043 RepID=A0A4Y3VAT9_9ACTN|nr:hypothetical protein SSP24_19170 [Streptomyces spinoverrucosus]GHB47297.1 hypothetical protein GCM10010397_16630 [Streptomyces spinoverrucosus]